jgi:predicted chitinase/GNAT superfamily N-acetyltransferase
MVQQAVFDRRKTNMRSTDFVSEYRAAGKVSVAGTIKLGNQFKDTYQVVNTPISHLYEVRIDDSPRESYPSYYFYNKDTGACVGSFSINAMPDAADDASPIVRPGVQIVQPHMTLAPEVQGKGLGSLIYDTFLAGGNWLFATFDHSSGAGALWDRMATKGSNISVLYNFNSDSVVEPGTKQAQTAVRILGPKERFKNKQGVAEGINEDAGRTEAQAAYMQGECMILAVAINQLNPKRYPIGYIWEYNISPGAPDIQLDDDEWDDLSPQEQQEISKDISRHSVVHAYVRDRETGEYIDARGRHNALPNLWGRMGQTRFEEFPGTARELINITAHGDWDEVGEEVNFKRGRPAFDSLAGPAGIKRAQDYAIKYLGVGGSENKAPGIDQQGVTEAGGPLGVSHFVTQRPTYRSPEKVSANHRVGITYTDGANPETLKKIVRVTANSPEESIKKSTIYFKRLGWTVVNTAHLGTLDEAVAEDSENYGGIQLSLEIEKDDEYVDDDDTDNQTIYVKATANGRELGHVLFTIDYDSQGMVLNPQDLEVEEKYRGQGIAETMYDYVKSKGYRIRRSGQQTDAGAAFWNKHKPGQNVWEQDELEEGWKDWVAGGAMALGALGAQANSIVSQLVEPGDTVYSIARQNGISPQLLYKLNGFNNNTRLQPGQEVKVPDVYTQTAKPAAKAPTAKPAIAQGVRGAVARANALKPVAKAQPKAAPVAAKVAPITGSKAEQLLMNTAVRSGITGTELAAFMAQMAHESDNFKSMKEYGGSLDFRKYDPKYAPKKAKTLGNKYAGDGNRFKGRGFIQITGRYNYRIASKAIGVDLVKNPKLAEDPAVAAKIAVWYWKLRVQPNVTNWNDVEAVTKPINPGMRGLEDRKENFADYITAMATVDKAV